jgi:hypothetical protein
MTITYPRALPSSRGMAGVVLRSRKVVGVSSAPFSLVDQTQEHQGERWEGEFTLVPMPRATAAVWIAWLRSLRGPYGSFLIGDPGGAAALGDPATVTDSPLVMGAGQTGRSLAIDGVAASRSPYIKAGSYLSLGSGSSRRLHQVLADANSNGSGQVTVDIWPKLREAPADNAAVVLNSTTMLARLMGPTVEEAIGAALLRRVAVVSFIEDLRP